MKTHTSAIVLIPDRGIWGPIQRIRRRHDRHIHRWMPHITMLYPFHRPEDLGQLDPKLHRVSASISAFMVRLETVRYFSHGARHFTMWLDPVPAEPIQKLQARLQTEFPDCNDVSKYAKGFTPHLSVGQVTGKETLQHVLTALQEQWIGLEMHVGAFHLIHREGDQPFRVNRSYCLGP